MISWAIPSGYFVSYIRGLVCGLCLSGKGLMIFIPITPEPRLSLGRD